MKAPLRICTLTLLVVISGCGSRDFRGDRFVRLSNLYGHDRKARSVGLINVTRLHEMERKRNGRLLLINFWATWCLPCTEEMPDLVRLARTYDRSRLEVVGVSLDYPDEIDTKVIPFLRKQHVPFKVFVAQFAKQEDFINGTDSAWNGAIPATFIYDSHGRRQYSLIGEGHYDQFKHEIDSLSGNLHATHEL